MRKQNTIPSSASAPISVSQARGVWFQSGSGLGAGGVAAPDVLAVEDVLAVKDAFADAAVLAGAASFPGACAFAEVAVCRAVTAFPDAGGVPGDGEVTAAAETPTPGTITL